MERAKKPGLFLAGWPGASHGAGFLSAGTPASAAPWREALRAVSGRVNARPAAHGSDYRRVSHDRRGRA